MALCKNVPVISLIVFQEWMWLLALSPSLPSEIVIAISSTGAIILSSNTGEFSSGQIESLATNPRQLHTTNASLRWPPVPKTTVTGFLPRPAQVASRPAE